MLPAVPVAAIVAALLVSALDNRSIASDLPETAAARAKAGVGELARVFALELATAEDPARRARIARRLTRELARTGELGPSLAGCVRTAACAALDDAEAARLAFALEQALAPWTLRHLARLVDLEPTPEGFAFLPPERAIVVPTVLRTILYALAVAALSTLVGAATGLAMRRASVRPLLLGGLFVSLATPHLVATIGWLDLARWLAAFAPSVASVGLGPGSRTLVLLATVSMLAPIVALPVAAAASAVPRVLHELAQLDGAGPWRRVFTVDLPLVRPVLHASAALVFAQTTGFFLVPELLGRPEDRPLAGLLAFYTSELPDPGAASAISLLLVLTAAPLALAAQAALGRSEPVPTDPTGADAVGSPRGLALAGLLASIFGTIPLVTLLVRTVLGAADRATLGALAADPMAARALVATGGIALLAASGTAFAGLLVTVTAAMRPRLLRLTIVAATLSVALPDLAVAAGWLRLADLTGLPEPWLLPLAFSLHALPVGLAALFGRLRLLDPALLEAARVDGAGGAALLRHIVAPLVAPALAVAALVAALSVATTSVLPIFLAGPRVPLTGWYLWTRLRDDFAVARAAAVLLLPLGFVAAALAWSLPGLRSADRHR